MKNVVCGDIYGMFVALVLGKRFRYTFHNKADGPIHTSIEKLDFAVSFFEDLVFPLAASVYGIVNPRVSQLPLRYHVA